MAKKVVSQQLTKHLTTQQQKEIKTILKSLGKSVVLNKYPWREANVSMGSGGKGQIQFKPRKKEIRIQTSYGKGRYNYADVIIIDVGTIN